MTSGATDTALHRSIVEVLVAEYERAVPPVSIPGVSHDVLLCLGTMTTTDTDVVIRRHPQSIFIAGPDRDRQKVLALSWDDGGSKPITLTRLADGSSDRSPSDL